MINTEPIIQGRKVTLCPTTEDWSVPQLVKTCPECGAFVLFCCACNNKYHHLPASRRPALPCHHFRLIFTDGACTNNGQPDAKAGIAVAFGAAKDSHMAMPIGDRIDDFPKRSNQRAELCAAKAGLEAIAAMDPLHPKCRSSAWIIATDSEYVVKGMTDWLPMWKGTPPSNSDLFLALDDLVTLYEKHGITIGFWHVPRECNQLAHRLAKKAAMYDDESTFF
ncbi:uncharacterized protein SETTUDRAFT_95804 [Exserohilum turcica Et28A]|uniref:ribonuclease H n=1 Tax=Exserohilum turcicum (strain 28A) TaxID=671987 RepID=R0JMM0_EXST2|nr:uncharacterized protein SETTUDRAFT_95804 [Exserohilum turcica Et28A]EOA82478.1 hypothetical protein SETTUDRAFT_95804 [Exserohilum turcica Et28A]